MRTFIFSAILSTISVASYATDPDLPENENAENPSPIVVKVEDDSAANVCSTVASQTREVACPSSHNQGGNLKYTEKGTFNCTTEQWEWTNLAASDISSIYQKCYKTVPNKVCTDSYQTMKKSCNARYKSGSDATEMCYPTVNGRSKFRKSEWDVGPCTAKRPDGKYGVCSVLNDGDYYYLRLKNYTPTGEACDKNGSCIAYNLSAQFTKKIPTTTCVNNGNKNVYYPCLLYTSPSPRD